MSEVQRFCARESLALGDPLAGSAIVFPALEAGTSQPGRVWEVAEISPLDDPHASLPTLREFQPRHA